MIPSQLLTRLHLGQESLLPELPVATAAPPVEAVENPDLLAIRRLLVAMLLLALMFTVYVAKPVLAPVLMAAFLAICISPMVSQVERVMPRLPAALIVVSMLLTLIMFLLSLLTAPAQEWLSHAPENLPQALGKLRAWLRLVGEASGTAPVLATVGSLSGADVDTPSTWHWWEILLAAPPVLIQVFSVVLLMLFFVAYGGTLFRRVVELSPTLTSKKQLVGILRAIQVDTARYFLTTALINASLGSATALVLWILGISEPLLWGAVVALLNFIPYLGPMVSILLLALVGVLQASTPDMAMLPALCFFALTLLEGQFLAPLVLGKRLSLSPVAILLWLMLWGWMWGVAGVILGVPMLMCLKLSCERLTSWRWLARSIE